MPIFKANAFRRARLAAELTQREAAKRIGVDPVTIIQWEKGSDFPQRNNLAKAADVYGCTVEQLKEKDD